MRRTKSILCGLIVVLALGLVGCGGSDGDESKVLGDAAKNADLVINDKSPFYDPEKLEIPLNREVTFTVFNEGKKLHNITIPLMNIDMDIAPGQSVEIKLPAASAPRDGFFSMYCKYHQAEGEATKLNIEG